MMDTIYIVSDIKLHHEFLSYGHKYINNNGFLITHKSYLQILQRIF